MRLRKVVFGLFTIFKDIVLLLWFVACIVAPPVAFVISLLPLFVFRCHPTVCTWWRFHVRDDVFCTMFSGDSDDECSVGSQVPCKDVESMGAMVNCTSVRWLNNHCGTVLGHVCPIMFPESGDARLLNVGVAFGLMFIWIIFVKEAILEVGKLVRRMQMRNGRHAAYDPMTP